MGNHQSSAVPYDDASALASKLQHKSNKIIAFLSPNCGLCRSLGPQLARVEENGIPVARLNSLESYTWAPEMIAYGVEAVPCIVLLDSQGYAIGKSRPPANTAQMLQALEAMITQSNH